LRYTAYMSTRQATVAARSGDKKIVPFNIRVSADEKAAFAAAAEVAGVPVSAWVRERLRKVSRKELEAANLPIPFVHSQP
jgi:predicted HicB family RNase H-like nuclease